MKTRDASFVMRLPAATKDAWKSAAELAGLPLSQWIEQIVNGAIASSRRGRKLTAKERTLNLPFPSDVVLLELQDILTTKPARSRAPKKKKRSKK